ncbi:MAG: SMC-Scp complex subunit ScpB [Bacteroidales bacterium]
MADKDTTDTVDQPIDDATAAEAAETRNADGQGEDTTLAGAAHPREDVGDAPRQTPVDEPPVQEPPSGEPPVEEPPPDEPDLDTPGDAPVEEPEDPPPAGDPGDEPPAEEPGDQPPALSEPSESNAPARVADPQLKAIIEALIFASPDPLTPKMLFKLLESEPKEDVQLAVESLRADYDRPGGLQLVEIANGYQIVTRAEMHEWVRRLFHERKTQKLSVQALETLAVIAYKQPITAPEIGEIRGVNTGGVINTLLERHLIKISGRKAVVGRPFLYSTTREFLIRFGLKDLGDLPKVEDLADVLGFEPPAGLTEGPTDARLPLDIEDDGESDAEKAKGIADVPPGDEQAPAEDEPAPDDVERVH